MELPIYQVDAFTDRPFSGNPAAVVPLDRWPPDEVLRAIAAENNLSETAFFLPEPEGEEADFHLRWFTPALEVDLCGHATLATAFVLFEILRFAPERVRFATRSGVVSVRRKGALLVLDFPARPPHPVGPGWSVGSVASALGASPSHMLMSERDLVAVFASEGQVRSLKPDFRRVAAMDAFAVIATAPGETVDFVSRFFAPRAGIDEDPVTGSAHCTLIPYWAGRLGRTSLRARQVSARGGELVCEHRGDRVDIGGRCALYMTGRITVPDA